MEEIIKVSRQEKITSLRVSERTKRELESFGTSGDSHEAILKKLIKIARSTESKTRVIKNKNMIGTEYDRSSKIFNIETEKDKYSVVCTYNDISRRLVMNFNITGWLSTTNIFFITSLTFCLELEFWRINTYRAGIMPGVDHANYLIITIIYTPFSPSPHLQYGLAKLILGQYVKVLT